MKSLPSSSYHLITELDKDFPNACPKLSDEDREIWFKAGQRSVVDYLLSLLAEAQENILETSSLNVLEAESP